jgi:hypothetical protein
VPLRCGGQLRSALPRLAANPACRMYRLACRRANLHATTNPMPRLHSWRTARLGNWRYLCTHSKSPCVALIITVSPHLLRGLQGQGSLAAQRQFLQAAHGAGLQPR